MPELCGLGNVGFLFGLLLIAAAVEAVTRLVLQDILGWRAPAHASPEEIADFERRYQLAASTLAVLIGVGVCGVFGIGILHWLKIGIPNLPPEQTRVLDYIFTGFIIGGGTRAVSALLKAWGLLPSLPFERKDKVKSQPSSAGATVPPADVIARLVEVDALPGLLWKTLDVPPAHVGVLYSGDVGAKVLPAGKHIVRALGAREPKFAALIDTTEFTLTPLSPRLTTADGESLDWTWRARLRVNEPLRFATRVLDHQPLVDRRALANRAVSELGAAIQSVVNDYDAGTLFDQPTASANIVRRLLPALDQFCADNGLERTEFASLDFAPALDEADALERLEALAGEAGQKALAQQLEAAPNVEQAVKAVEEKAGTPRLLTPEEEKQVKQDLATPATQARGIALLGRAIERKLNEVRQRVEDRLEQLLTQERRQTKMDKFMQRNAQLLAWATRLKLLGGVIVAAIPVIGVFAPDLIPDSTTLRAVGAAIGLVAAVAAFLGSLWLGSEFNQRRADFERGWLNRLSAERVLESEALLRARVANELRQAADNLRAARNRLVAQRTETAIRMKEVEEKMNRLRQEVEGAETGQLLLRMGERVSAKQAQRLMDLQTSLRRDAEQLTARASALGEPIANSNLDAVEQAVAACDATLTSMRNRFAQRAMILRGS